MNMRQLAGALTIIAIQACVPVVAQVAPMPVPVPERAVVEQKRALVARILTDSPTANGVVGGMSTEAQEQLASAAHLQKRAQAQLEKGEIAAADRSLNDAMRHITRARSLASGPGLRAGAEQTRYTDLLRSIEVLKVSYLRNVERRSTWLAEVGDEDQMRVQIHVNRAKAMAASGQVAEANAVLVKAQRDMISSYNGLLGTAPMVIVYDLRFNSEEEEYKYESERRQDYQGLVPVAIQEYKPRRESLAKIYRLVDESSTLAASAGLQAEKKQFQNAVQLQRRAIAKLQQALELAGIVVPQHLPN